MKASNSKSARGLFFLWGDVFKGGWVGVGGCRGFGVGFCIGDERENLWMQERNEQVLQGCEMIAIERSETEWGSRRQRSVRMEWSEENELWLQQLGTQKPWQNRSNGGGTCDSSGCVRGGWRVFLLLWWGISLGWEKSADSLRRNKDWSCNTAEKEAGILCAGK